ncbi:aminotransferase [Alsobacter sp. SYSU M60028]|uniref:aspartate transaminase n=1 Tax=Alsobacter ponti TaxID=2962936 RepID=A0ABT1LGM2_9HYPH|nr:aminotransferase [Alsobacter ponti]MCP8940651.1 aminotransferase [Alsobacter ponti]
MNPVNPHLADTGSPPIPEAQAWLRRYEGARGPLLDLSQAVPGYPPHDDMLARLAAAAGDAACAGYGPIVGDAQLREAYAAHVSELYGARVDAGEVAITAGCNQAFFVAMIALARAGDAVLLPSPWYFNHQMTLAMLGVEARALPCRAEAGFVPDPDEAERRIDARTRAIVLVTPNNPTGAIYPPHVIQRFAELCRRRGLWLVLDETYRDFMPGEGDVPHALFADPAWRDSVVGLYSFSKSYCIPGHRIGAITAGAKLGAEIAKVLDCMQICAARPGQAALAWAIPALAEWREANRQEIAARAAAFEAAVAAAPGWRVDSVGAYFAYLAHPFPGLAASRVGERLAAERGVLGLPGSYFGPGQDTHLRIAFANADRARIALLPERLAGFAA